MALTGYFIIEDVTAQGLAEKVMAVLPAKQPLGGVIFNEARKTFAQVLTTGAADGELPAGAVAVQDGDTVATSLGDGSASIADSALTVNLPATLAGVSNTDTVHVQNSAGADQHDGTAAVAAGALTAVKLAATTALVDNADAVTVHNSAGSAVAGAHTAEVAAGVLTDVKLAATVAPVADGATLTGVAPSGAYTDTVTFTVANGVITGIALS